MRHDAGDRIPLCTCKVQLFVERIENCGGRWLAGRTVMRLAVMMQHHHVLGADRQKSAREHEQQAAANLSPVHLLSMNSAATGSPGASSSARSVCRGAGISSDAIIAAADNVATIAAAR